MRRPRDHDEEVMERGSVTPSIADVVVRLREQLRILERVAGEMVQTFVGSCVEMAVMGGGGDGGEGRGVGGRDL